MPYNADYIALGRHFDTRNGDNLACRCCGKVIINPDTIAHYSFMDRFREWYGRSMSVNSGCRCEKHNAKEKGGKQSQHLDGLATDWMLPAEFHTYTKARKQEFLKNARRQWFIYCTERGIGGGVGFYNDFIHFDSRPGTRATWDFSDYFK